MNEKDRAAKVLGKIIGSMEDWRTAFADVTTYAERVEINGIKKRLIAILDRLEDEKTK